MDFRGALAQQWARYERLSDREQTLAIITLCVILFAAFIFFIWDPVSKAQNSSEKRYQAELKMQTELLALHSRMRPRKASMTGRVSDQSLLAVVNESTSSRGISLKRVEPKSDQSLRVWIENVSFNQLIAWIGLLSQKHGVSIDTISLDRTPVSGYINTALVVSR